MMISYGQNAEDVLLRRALGDAPGGFFIDAGANDPVFDSVTKHVSLHGWTGINIEPQPDCFARIQRDRPGEINLQVGLSDRPGTLTLYDDTSADGWSTFSAAQAAALRAQGHVLVERTVRSPRWPTSARGTRGDGRLTFSRSTWKAMSMP